MSSELKPWDEQRIIAEAEALAAHFKKHDLDHYEMSRLIVRDMRQVKDHFEQRIADLERIVDANGTFVQEAMDEVKRLEAGITKWQQLAEGTAALWTEARDELAKLRAEAWQPVEDGYSIDDDRVQIQVQIGVGATWLAIRNADVRFWPQLPDNIRLCKRGDA